MSFRTKILPGVAMLALVSPTIVSAAGSARDGLQAMKELNLIVLGDLHGGHEVEGKTFVGGNLSGNDENFGIGNSRQGGTASDRATLTVAGNVSSGLSIQNGSNGGNGTVATRKTLVIGGSRSGGNFNVDGAKITIGSNTSGFNINNGTDVSIGGSYSGFNNRFPIIDASLRPGGLNDVSAALVAERTKLADDLGALATALGGLAIANNPSSINATDRNNVVFNAVDGGNGYALFTVGQSFFDMASSFSFNATTALPIIINVSGSTSYTINSNSNNSLFNQNIIWNFLDATGITFNKQFNGSILAPSATISNSTPLEGSVVAKIFNQSGEVHLGTYARNLDFLPKESAVPEPATWVQFILGFGLVGAWMRRRKPVVA